MTAINYDGSTNLQPAIAALYGCSLKNQGKIAKLVKQAKAALQIDANRNLSQQQRADIYNWHVKKLSSTNDMTTNNDTAIDELVKNAEGALKAIANDEKIYKQVNTDGETEEPAPDHYPTYAVVRVAFYTHNIEKTRQVIALNGYILNALMLVAGLEKKGIPTWIQTAVNNSPNFDTSRAITKQVEALIIERLLKKSKKQPHRVPLFTA
jgi:LmbE family N-acetylglucosaminyl deacetylase